MGLERETASHDDWSLAEIVILSQTVAADRLAQAIGLPPDRSWNRGEPKKTRGLVEKFNGMTYCSRVPRTVDVHDHLADLLARLAPVKDRIAALSRRLTEEDGRLDPIRIWLTQLTRNASPGYDFSPAQVALVGEMGAWLGVSVDVYDPDEAEVELPSGAEPAENPDLAGIGGAAERVAGEAG